MYPATSPTRARYLGLASKAGALMFALVLMSGSWAVAAVCHGCDPGGGGGGGGGGGTGCGTLGSTTTFGQEPRISGTPKVGSPSSFSKTAANPTPSDVDVTLTSWHRGMSSTWADSYASVGTGSTYTPAGADRNYYLFAKFTVSRTGPFSCEETWITDGKHIGFGDAAVVTAQPQISGGTDVGSVLSATTGTWTPAPGSYFFQWRRDGVDIPGVAGIGSTHIISESDLGTTVSVQVKATVYGHHEGIHVTPGVVIPKAATTIAISALPSASRFGVAKRGTVTVSTASGVAAGTLEVRHGSKVLQRVGLVNGRAGVNLSRSLAVRPYTLTFAFKPGAGSPHAASSLVRTHTVKQARTTTRHKWLKKPTRKKAGKVRIYVTSPDVSKVTTGKVRIKVGKMTYTKTLKKGYVDIKIGKLKKGKRTFVRSYLGSTSFAKASSRKFRLRVK